MRKLFYLLSIVLTVSLISSCDFFRSLAGRPTSAEIAVKAARIEKIEQERARLEMARRDSVEKVRMAVADSLAAMDSLAAGVFKMSRPRGLSSSTLQKLDRRYYIVLGSFSDRNNARRLLDRVSASGYETVTLDFSSGSTAVAACPSDNIASAFSSLKSLRQEPYCPADAWIMEIVW